MPQLLATTWALDSTPLQKILGSCVNLVCRGRFWAGEKHPQRVATARCLTTASCGNDRACDWAAISGPQAGIVQTCSEARRRSSSMSREPSSWASEAEGKSVQEQQKGKASPEMHNLVAFMIRDKPAHLRLHG